MVAKITVDGVELRLAPCLPDADAKGKHWCQTHTWHNPSDAKIGVVEQPANHGGFPNQPAWRESVLVSFEGFSWGANRSDYQRLRNELAQLGAGKETVKVTVRDQDEETWRHGYVVAVNIEDDHNRNLFKWSLDIRCPDPRRYGSIQERREFLAAGGSQYSLASAKTLTDWHCSTGAGIESQPNRLDGGWVTWDTGSAAKTAMFYRLNELLYPVRRVRLFVKAPSGLLRLSLSWMRAGMLKQVQAFNPQTMDGQTVFDQMVTQPAWADGLTVGVEAFDPSMPEVSCIQVQGLMVGAFIDASYQDGDSLGWAWLGVPGKSASAQLGTRWPLDNRDGTAPSTPAICIEALQDMPGGFTLSFYGSSASLVYSGDIPAGVIVELIPGEHAVLIDGKLSPIVAVGTWPVVPGGELMQLSLTANSKTNFAAVSTWAPAWW